MAHNNAALEPSAQPKPGTIASGACKSVAQRFLQHLEPLECHSYASEKICPLFAHFAFFSFNGEENNLIHVNVYKSGMARLDDALGRK